MDSRLVRSLIAIAWLSFCQPAASQTRCIDWLGQLASAQGRVESRIAEKPVWKTAALNESYCHKDQLRTWVQSRAVLALSNETYLTVDQKTTLHFTEPEGSTPSWIEMIKGMVYFRSRMRRLLEIKTPFVNAIIRGTEFLVAVREDHTEIVVFEGTVDAVNRYGSLTLGKGQAAVAERGRAPALIIRVRPKDAVQWTLYYPPIFDGQMPSPDPAGITLQAALKAHRQGDLITALETLSQVPEEKRSAQYYLIRAQLLLTVGRVDEARPDIEQALAITPENSSAISLQSIIAVAQNNNEKALQLARQAANADPKSATAHIALSYAYQSKFDLKNALQNVKKATGLAPDNGLAWARLAELELSMGHHRRALRAAQKSVALNPNLARAQSVRGFAELMQLDIGDAKANFENAIRLDPAAPLPRLGLGLAKIRQGDLEEGVEDIQISASLDPDNSLIRSYLGKAYYEMKDDKWAEKELAIAKDLDPLDPTPWFYDAIRKQTTNRPVEALQAINQAIALNDNRAVYRSRLLLDDDLAARSASLGRIYNDLGFQQLGLVEGWKSVDTDPSNHSAHRLLADNYAALPRHEIARVSELLQSQLLQNINITPVQPRLVESNLVVLDGLGPSDPSFNEFNPLFARNRLALQASGIVGTNDSYGDEVTQSGLWNKFSYSLGQFHSETDGFRDNNRLKEDIYNVFLQGQLTPELGLQAEFRRRRRTQGDLALNFDVDKFTPGLQRKLTQETSRLGFRFSPMAHSDFLVSAIHSDRHELTSTTFPFSQADLQDNREGYQLEARYLFRHDWINASMGGGSYRIEVDPLLRVEFIGLPLPPFSTREKSTDEHNNLYAYVNVNMPKRMTLTFGVSHDSLNIRERNLHRTNPKAGVTWNVTDAIRLRLAYFQAAKRSLIADQTLEPTQVAGFNQFFDDINGANTERYGVGLDTILTNTLYGGVEYSKREIEFDDKLGTQTINRNREESLIRGYLYWTPHPRWSLSFEPEFERFDRSRSELSVTSGGNASQVKTVFAPLSVRYFDPSGFFAGLRGTYVNQDVDVTTLPTFFGQPTAFSRENAEFFLVDASLGYRLPKRLGIISVQARNLLDKNFTDFQDFGIQTVRQAVIPRFIPDRTISLQVTFAFN